MSKRMFDRMKPGESKKCLAIVASRAAKKGVGEGKVKASKK